MKSISSFFRSLRTSPSILPESSTIRPENQSTIAIPIIEKTKSIANKSILKQSIPISKSSKLFGRFMTKQHVKKVSFNEELTKEDEFTVGEEIDKKCYIFDEKGAPQLYERWDRKRGNELPELIETQQQLKWCGKPRKSRSRTDIKIIIKNKIIALNSKYSSEYPHKKLPRELFDEMIKAKTLVKKSNDNPSEIMEKELQNCIINLNEVAIKTFNSIDTQKIKWRLQEKIECAIQVLDSLDCVELKGRSHQEQKKLTKALIGAIEANNLLNSPNLFGRKEINLPNCLKNLTITLEDFICSFGADFKKSKFISENAKHKWDHSISESSAEPTIDLLRN